ncbi:MAG: anti-sigma factor [Planctomycetaceae bacterium]
MHCDLLEDYICRCLDPAETEAFEQHLEHCVDCSDVVESESSLFTLLAQASHQLEPVPQTIASRPRPESTTGRPRQGRSAGIAIAVSVLALIGLVGTALQTQGPDMAGPTDRTESLSLAPTYVAPPRIELPEGTSAISVASGDPNISIILMNAPQPTDLNLYIPSNSRQLASSH